jgi:serine/threonine-protein kinase
MSSEVKGKFVVSEEIQTRVSRKVCLSCGREFTGVVTACPHDGTVLIPLIQDPLVGTKLADRYFIHSVVGHGGMGIVYKARHELMDRDVAIKVLKADLISDSMSVKRFQQEARAACKLKHPNVITLFDFGVSPNGQPYLVMDYLKGISLADVIKKDGHVGVDRSIRIFVQACRALEHAHREKVIHRDMKPGNIMLVETDDEREFVKVVDFGVAKLIGDGEDAESQRLTQTGEVCGSPVYMSPEQCEGRKLGPYSDIYSMGVVLYEALTGRLPLLGKTMVETMQKHLSEIPPPFGEIRPDLYIPERLESVVLKAMAKDPASRHQSMAELERDLEVAVPKSRTTIQPGDSFQLPSRPAKKPPVPVKRKRPDLVAAVVVLLVVTIGGTLAWFAIKNLTAPHPPASPTDARAIHQLPDKAPAVVPTPEADDKPGPVKRDGAALKQSAVPAAAPSQGAAPKKQSPSNLPTARVAEQGEKKTRTGNGQVSKDQVARSASKPDLGVARQRTTQTKAKKSASKQMPLQPSHTLRAKDNDPFADLARSRSYKPN